MFIDQPRACTAIETPQRPGGDGRQVTGTRRRKPRGSRGYVAIKPATTRRGRGDPPPRPGTVEALRFAVTGQAALPDTHGVLLADLLHRMVVRELDGGRAEVIGHAGAANDHTHAHWVPIPDRGEVTALLVWVPVGLSTSEVAAVLTATQRGGRAECPTWLGGDAGELPEPRLDLQAAGPVATVAPELCGTSRVWRTLTPYLPVRHRKHADLSAHLTEDVRHELAYRGRPPALVRRLGPAGDETDDWAATYRRHRLNEDRPRHRPGYGLRLVFDEPQTGPLLLGQLSHFGFGIFIPEGGER